MMNGKPVRLSLKIGLNSNFHLICEGAVVVSIRKHKSFT